MEAAFSWLGELFGLLLDFIPRWLIVKQTHGGVAFVRGKNAQLVEPGMRFFWPFWTEIILYPVVRQTMNLPQQTLTTLDGESIQINSIVVYKVDDVLKMLTLQFDIEETIRDLSLASIKTEITSRTFDEITNEQNKIDCDLTESLNEELAYYGVDIVKVALTDFAKTRVYTLSGMGNQHKLFPV